MSLFSRLKFYLKSTIFAFLILFCSLYGVIISIPLKLLGLSKFSQYLVAKAFYFTLSKALGVHVNIENAHFLNSNPAIYISNHQSALDILILGKVFQPGFTVTGKSSLKYIPFLGWFMYLSGTFFLNRSKSDKARQVLNSALSNLKKNDRGLFIFPEGTRSTLTTLDLLPFKKGAFHLAKSGKIPVVPVVVSNTSNIFSASKKIFNRGTINIKVLEPLKTDQLETNEDVTNFTNNIRDSMIKELKIIGYSKLRNQENDQNVSDIDATVVESSEETVVNEPTETTKLLNKST